jgi:hypothetical protein
VNCCRKGKKSRFAASLDARSASTESLTQKYREKYLDFSREGAQRSIARSAQIQKSTKCRRNPLRRKGFEKRILGEITGRNFQKGRNSQGLMS